MHEKNEFNEQEDMYSFQSNLKRNQWAIKECSKTRESKNWEWQVIPTAMQTNKMGFLWFTKSSSIKNSPKVLNICSGEERTQQKKKST